VNRLRKWGGWDSNENLSSIPEQNPTNQFGSKIQYRPTISLNTQLGAVTNLLLFHDVICKNQSSGGNQMGSAG